MKKNNLPMVTVITPAYNRADLIEETILSILNQDYPNIEYIVLDDGSKDNTFEIIEKYKNKIICSSHKNMGEARTVNKGFSMAKGEIVVVVNSDDPIFPNTVSSAVSYMKKHPDVLVAYPDWAYIDEHTNRLGIVRVPEYSYDLMLGEHKCLPGPAAFIRRKAFDYVKGRDPFFKYVGDFEFWIQLGLHGEFAHIPKLLATFRVHPNSLSMSDKGAVMASEDTKILDKLYSQKNLPNDVIKIKRRAYSSACYHAAQTCEPNLTEARKYYIKSLKYYPLNYCSLHKLSLLLRSFLPKKLYNKIRKIKN